MFHLQIIKVHINIRLLITDIPVTKSIAMLLGDCGVAPFFLYQLLTLILNLSPAITFIIIEGSILFPPPFTLATLLFGLV